MNSLGYACICETLKKRGITTNRGMIKRTFQEKGIEYASELALKNVTDLFEIIKWNNLNSIKLFRMSSDLFPWMSEYKIKDLPDYEEISKILATIGDYSRTAGIRLSFHPGPFNILCSPRESVVDNTISELDKHSEIMDLMGLPASHYAKINIHIGGAYGDKKPTLDRWIKNFHRLSENTKKRLTIENDDKQSLYTVRDLMYVHEKIGIPIVFDYHHWSCHPGEDSLEDSFKLAMTTWGNTKPVVHYSSSRQLNEDSSAPVVAHADYIYEEIDDFGYSIDIMLETKAKELALIKYREEQDLIDSSRRVGEFV